MHRRKTAALFGISLFLMTASALAITCEECKELENTITLTDQEIKKQDGELERAFRRKDSAKVAQTQKYVAELSKKLVELKTKTLKCKDACRPDAIKKAECSGLLAEIAALEADTKSEDTNTEAIDEKYKALLNCHKELQQLTKQK